MNYILHSIRIGIQSEFFLKNKDKVGQQTLLKYWCINWMISLQDIFLQIVLNEYSIIFNLVFQLTQCQQHFAIGLIYNNFKFSTAIFNNSIQPFIYQHEKKIEKFFSFIDEKIKSVWDKSSDTLEQAAKKKIGEVVADQFQKK